MENDRTKHDLENMKNGLIVKRRHVGANTRDGYLLSNLIEQTPWMSDTTGDRSWAKHPTQNMPWLMNVQIKGLTR